MTCKHCFNTFPDNAGFCPYCGKPAKQKDKQPPLFPICPKCGRELPKGTTQCPICDAAEPKNPPVKCPGCGTPVAADLTVCNQCGYDMSATATNSSAGFTVWLAVICFLKLAMTTPSYYNLHTLTYTFSSEFTRTPLYLFCFCAAAVLSKKHRNLLPVSMFLGGAALLIESGLIIYAEILSESESLISSAVYYIFPLLISVLYIVFSFTLWRYSGETVKEKQKRLDRIMDLVWLAIAACIIIAAIVSCSISLVNSMQWVNSIPLLLYTILNTLSSGVVSVIEAFFLPLAMLLTHDIVKKRS